MKDTRSRLLRVVAYAFLALAIYGGAAPNASAYWGLWSGWTSPGTTSECEHDPGPPYTQNHPCEGESDAVNNLLMAHISNGGNVAVCQAVGWSSAGGYTYVDDSWETPDSSTATWAPANISWHMCRCHGLHVN